MAHSFVWRWQNGYGTSDSRTYILEKSHSFEPTAIKLSASILLFGMNINSNEKWIFCAHSLMTYIFQGHFSLTYLFSWSDWNQWNTNFIAGIHPMAYMPKITHQTESSKLAQNGKMNGMLYERINTFGFQLWKLLLDRGL